MTMIRSIFGIVYRPVDAAHHLSRRSWIFWSGDAATSFHGPVVTGRSLAMSNALNVVQSCPSKMCFGTG
jgi:hypothetical protein